MKIYTGIAHSIAPRYTDLRDILATKVRINPNRPIYSYKSADRKQTFERSYKQLWEDLMALGTALQDEVFHAGVTDEKRRIAVIGENSYSWVLGHNVAMFGAGLAVPLDKLLTDGEVISLLERSRATILFLDKQQSKRLPALLEAGLPLRHIIWTGEEVSSLSLYHENAQKAELTPAETRDGITLWELPTLLAYGYSRREAGDTGFESLPIDADAVAAILFTSGTTARSKGVMLSHRNICENVRMVGESISLLNAGRCLSILPLHHIFENAAEYAFWEREITICFNDGLRYISPNLKTWGIEIMVAVPLVVESMYRQIQLQLKKQKKDKLIARLRSLSRALLKVGLDLRKPLFKALRQAVAPDMKLFIVGAAPLSREVEEFFWDIGMPIFVGYGMTECAPLITCNNQWNHVCGKVGTPCAGVELRIDDGGDGSGFGEVVCRSGGVMKGYYEDEAATAEVLLQDGWLRTGDMGSMDKEGRLTLTGRSKSMIVLPNGKKAFPEEIESLFTHVEGVSNLMAFAADNARGGKDIAILFELDAQASASSVLERLAGSVREANSRMPEYKNVRYWMTTKDHLILTPTRKLKRRETQALITDFLEAHRALVSDYHQQEIQLQLDEE